VAIGWITGADAGRLAVSALLLPERFEPGPVYLTGTGTASHAEIAALIGDDLGREVRHETISEREWCDRLLELAAAEPRINADMARHISVLGAAIRRDQEPNRLFEQLTGEPARSVRETIAGAFRETARER
jgi:uncharacterized protein YbjT (DUF2867 family)